MSESTYTVKPGDSLSLIAKNLWGDAIRWKEIFEANRDQIKDPNLIRVGQVLKIPGAQTEPAPSAPPEPAPTAPTELTPPLPTVLGTAEGRGFEDVDTESLHAARLKKTG